MEIQSYAQTNNCGNFLISVLFLVCFFISDLFLIFNELKEEVKNGDDEEVDAFKEMKKKLAVRR